MKTDRSRTAEDEETVAGQTDVGQTDGRQRRAESGGAYVSRRSLLAAGGVLAGTGLPGIGSASADPGSSHQVTATAPYLATVRDALADEQGVAELAVERVSSDAASPIDDGDVTVHVSGQPVLDRGEQSGPAPADAVAVAGRAALVHTDGEWRDCLPRSTVREEWTGETPVETWSELPSSSAGGASDAGDPGPAADSTGAAPSDDATQLVRGTRSAQYARGCGGESYYAVESDALEAVPGNGEDAEASSTPVTRLAYVHVDESVRDDASVETLLERLGADGAVGDGTDGSGEDGSASSGGSGVPFLDPAVDAD